jgi:hypothetical protein
MSNDLVHLTGVIKTQPVLDHLNTPGAAPTVRLVNTLIGPANERHTLVFTGDQARAARQALTARIPLRVTGRVIAPRRIEVVYFTLDGQRAEPRPPRLRSVPPIPPNQPDPPPARISRPDPPDQPGQTTASTSEVGDHPPDPEEAPPRPTPAALPEMPRPDRRSPQVHRRRVDRTGHLRL